MSFSKERRELSNILADSSPIPRPRGLNFEARLSPRLVGRFTEVIKDRVHRARQEKTRYLEKYFKHGAQTGAAAAQAAVEAPLPDKPPILPPLEFVTSPPILQQGRPNQPFLVDDTYPSEELATLDLAAKRELEEASGPHPNTHWRLKRRPHHTLDGEFIPEKAPPVPRAARPLKRKASTTELDLAQPTIHAIFAGPPPGHITEAQLEEQRATEAANEIVDQAANEIAQEAVNESDNEAIREIADEAIGEVIDDDGDVVMQTEPRGVVGSVINIFNHAHPLVMFTSVSHALTGFGRRVTRYISNPSNPSQQIVETRYEGVNGNTVNKRRKLTKEYEKEVQWASDETLQSRQDEFTEFKTALLHRCNRPLTDIPGLLTRRNDLLRPLGPLLAGSVSRPSPIMTGKILPNNHNDLYRLFLADFFDIVPKLYDPTKIAELKASHGPTLRPQLIVESDPWRLTILSYIKDVLSFPALPYILYDLMRCPHAYVEHSTCRFRIGAPTLALIDGLILDIHAIMVGLIPPSWLNSPDYLKAMKARFPAPVRKPVEPPMPGTFPNELQQIIPRSASPPPEAPNPTGPVQEAQGPATASSEAQNPPSAPIEGNAGSAAETTISRTDSGSTSKATRIRAWSRYITTFWNRQNEQAGEQTEASRVVKAQYIKEFNPRLPLNDYQHLSSILRTRHRHPSKLTPKRLKSYKLPKRVRFTASTASPMPRTHIRSDVARLKEPCRPLRFTNTGLAFGDVRPRLSFSRDLSSPPTSPGPSTSSSPPTSPSPSSPSLSLVQSPPPPAQKEEPREEPRVETDEEKAERVRSLDAFFAEPSPLSLQLSDHASATIAQKREEEARIATEAAEAAERAAAEKARIELEARLALTGGLRVPKQQFVSSLSGDWIKRVHDTLTSAPTTSLTTTVEGIDLRRHDFAKVVPETEWLNDEIVNGTLMWLDQAINLAAGIKDVKRNTRKCLTMSSFFFKQLRERGVGRTQRTLRRYGVEKRNFLDVDTILLPICERSHWTLLVVRPSKRTVCHMDSMNPVGSTPITNLGLAWVKDVLEEAFVADDWTVVTHEAPRQTNGWDCGVFTITNAMCVSLGLNPIDCYSAADMPRQRLRIAGALLNRGFSGDFGLGMF